MELEWCHCLLFSAVDVKTNTALSRVPWWLCLQRRNNAIAREHISNFNQRGRRQAKTCHPLFRSAIHRLPPDKKSPQIKPIVTMGGCTWIIIAKHTTQCCNQLLLLKILVASYYRGPEHTTTVHKSVWEQSAKANTRPRRKAENSLHQGRKEKFLM